MTPVPGLAGALGSAGWGAWHQSLCTVKIAARHLAMAGVPVGSGVLTPWK